jgi:hypothetical protein
MRRSTTEQIPASRGMRKMDGPQGEPAGYRRRGYWRSVEEAPRAVTTKELFAQSLKGSRDKRKPA